MCVCVCVSRLFSIQIKHLRSILHIGWEDHITNVDVLHRAGMLSVEGMFAESQLSWASHVARMDDQRIPKAVVYGELLIPKLCFKNTLKRHFDVARHSVLNFETMHQVGESFASRS